METMEANKSENDKMLEAIKAELSKAV